MGSSTDTVQHWLKGASRYPLLNKGQEVQLSRDIHAWLDCENPTKQVERRGKRAKDKLFNCNLLLVVSVAKKYQSRINGNSGVDFVDVLQEGCRGLARACEKFDHERGFAFSTYSYWWIRQSIGRYVEINQSVIKVSNSGSQIAMRWRYRPEGMTIEEFAEKEKRTVKNCLEYIENVRRTEVYSLDAKLKCDDSDSSLIDFQSGHDADLEDSDWVDAVEGLHQVEEIKDSMALLELAQQSSPVEMGELMDCSPHVVHKKLLNVKAQVREHCPQHIRERIVGKEKKVLDKIELPISLPELSPARELALVSCSSDSSMSMPDAIAQPSANGRQSLESEAMEVIAAVQSEASAEAVKPTRKPRNRTKAEVAPVKPQGLINVSVEGCNYEGTAADVAQLINALRAA